MPSPHPQASVEILQAFKLQQAMLLSYHVIPAVQLMDKEEDLTFYLRQQQTIELIMQDKIEEALEYAEYHFAPLGKDRPDLKEEIGES